MVVRLDPRYPIVWRSPDSLQIGIAPPRAVLDTVSTADEHMIVALGNGISESGLTMLGRAAGATTAQVENLLTRVRGALLDAPVPRRPVHVSGTGRTADAVSRALAAAGHEGGGGHPDLVVIVAQFVVAPELYGTWLRRDIPHLPVVVLDTAVEIGPIVEPGAGPCLYCLLAETTERDPSWPAIAAQLSGRESSADTTAVAGEVAPIVARLASARLDDGPAEIHESIRLDLGSGAMTRRTHEQRATCGCAGLDSPRPTTDPTENDSPAGDPAANRLPRPPRTTTARASGAHA